MAESARHPRLGARPAQELCLDLNSGNPEHRKPVDKPDDSDLAEL